MAPHRIVFAVAVVAILAALAFWLASTAESSVSPPPVSVRSASTAEAASPPVPIESEPVVTSVYPRPKEDGKKPDAPSPAESPLKKSIDNLLPAGLEFSAPSKDNAVLFGRWIQRRDRQGRARDLRATRLGLKDEPAAWVIVTCDVEGLYRFDIKPGTYDVAFGATLHRVVLAAGEERRFDPVEPLGAVVFVKWLGSNLNLQNAEVTSTSFDAAGAKTVARARTGSNGTAELKDVPPGPARITGTTTTYPAGDPVRAAADVSVPWSGTLEVVLQPPENSLVLETVSAADGRGLSGVVGQLRVDSRTVRKVSDRLGVLHFDSIPIGRFAIQLTDDIHVPVFETVVVDRAESKRRIAMSAGRTLQVLAKDQHGEPMRMILKGRRPGSDDPRPLWEARRDGDGLGEFKALPWQEQTIEILVDTCDPLVVTFPANGARPTPFELNFTKRVN